LVSFTDEPDRVFDSLRAERAQSADPFGGRRTALRLIALPHRCRFRLRALAWFVTNRDRQIIAIGEQEKTAGV